MYGVPFDLVMIMVTYGSFGALVSKWRITTKRLIVQWNGEIWDGLGTLLTHIWDILGLSELKVMLGLFCALIFKMACRSKGLPLGQSILKCGTPEHCYNICVSSFSIYFTFTPFRVYVSSQGHFGLQVSKLVTSATLLAPSLVSINLTPICQVTKQSKIPGSLFS